MQKELLYVCLLYVLSQIEDSYVAVLNDATGKGYDSAEYHDYQIATVKKLLGDLYDH